MVWHARLPHSKYSAKPLLDKWYTRRGIEGDPGRHAREGEGGAKGGASREHPRFELDQAREMWVQGEVVSRHLQWLVHGL